MAFLRTFQLSELFLHGVHVEASSSSLWPGLQQLLPLLPLLLLELSGLLLVLLRLLLQELFVGHHALIPLP